MASESRRGVIRLATNYIRLASVILLGLWLAQIQLDAVGIEGFGLIALLGSTAGLSSIIDAVIRRSMVRELGSAFHSDDPSAFSETLNSAFVVVAGGALFTALLAGVLWAVLPFLTIPDGFFDAARLFVICKGVEFVIQILMTPAFNLYLVTERMVQYNIWSIINRMAYVVAAFGALLLSPNDAPRALVVFGVLSAAGNTLVVGSAILALAFQMPLLRLRPSLATRSGITTILRMSGWNALVIVANNLHLRLDAILMNVWFTASFGNVVFGTGSILANYVRRATSGVTDGVEAVAARVSTKSTHHRVRKLVLAQTRLHAFVSAPAAVLLGVLTAPVMEVWLGKRLEADPALLPAAVTVGRILIVGTAVRAVADAWVRVFYGTGDIKEFALLTLVAGACNPLVAVVLWKLHLLPQDWAYTGPAIAYVLTYAVFAMTVLPIPASRILKVRYYDMLRPVVPSILCAVAGAPILFAFARFVPQWDLLWLLAVSVVYGAAYAGLAFIFVMSSDERAKLLTLARCAVDPAARRELMQSKRAKKRTRELIEEQEHAAEAPAD